MSMTGFFLEIDIHQYKKILSSPSYAEELIFEPEKYGSQGRSLNIDKTWEGIHFLLTGRTSAETKAPDIILGGESIGEDLGYGPARVMSPELVSSACDSLSEFSQELLQGRFNRKTMFDNKIYPPIWNDEERSFDYLYRHFEELREYYVKAQKNGAAMLLCIV